MAYFSVFLLLHIFAAPEVPGLIVVTSVTPTTITLAWSDPHRGVLDGYNIEADPPDGVVVEGNDPEDKWRRIQDLTPGENSDNRNKIKTVSACYSSGIAFVSRMGGLRFKFQAD